MEMNRPQRQTRKRQKHILILTQGKTEEIYFNSFPIVRKGSEWTVQVKIESVSLDPLQLVERAVNLRDEALRTKNIKYQKVWCVFDKDDFKQNFREGIKKADDENISHAFSIESFELWLLLHFTPVAIDSSLDRNEYIRELEHSKRLPGYCKEQDWLEANISYRKLGNSGRNEAIQRSKELEAKSRKTHTIYQKQNCTIHRIVEYLQGIT